MIVLPPSLFSPETRCRSVARAQARIVDAAVLEEAIVLGRQHRIHHLIRNRFERQRDAALLAELSDQPAVAAVHAQRHLQLDVPDRGDVGQRRLQILISAESPSTTAAHEQDDGSGKQAERRLKVTSHHNK